MSQKSKPPKGRGTRPLPDGLKRRKALFSPWRLEFIKGPKDPYCFFCEAAGLKANDRGGWKKWLLLYRDRNAEVVINRYPYISGHLLIAPRRHTCDLPGMRKGESKSVWELSRLCLDVLKKVMAPQGFNIGMNLGRAAGAGVEDHLHMHVMPRWVGDTNFMPTIGHTQMVPASLETLWDEMFPVFRKLG